MLGQMTTIKIRAIYNGINFHNMNKLTNRQLFKKYKEMSSDFKSENAFGNFCARTLTMLLYLEKEITQRGYKIVSFSKKTYFFK